MYDFKPFSEISQFEQVDDSSFFDVIGVITDPGRVIAQSKYRLIEIEISNEKWLGPSRGCLLSPTAGVLQSCCGCSLSLARSSWVWPAGCMIKGHVKFFNLAPVNQEGHRIGGEYDDLHLKSLEDLSCLKIFESDVKLSDLLFGNDLAEVSQKSPDMSTLMNENVNDWCVGGFEFPFGADVEEVSHNAFLTPDLPTATNGKGLEWVAEGCVKRCLDLEFEECDDVCGFQPKKKEKVGDVKLSDLLFGNDLAEVSQKSPDMSTLMNENVNDWCVGGFEFPFGADVEEVSHNAFLTPDLPTATNGKGLEWVAEGCVKRCLDLEFEECDDVCGFQPKKKEKVGGVSQKSPDMSTLMNENVNDWCVGGFEFPFGADVEEVSHNAFLTLDLPTATNGKGLEWVAEGCVKRCLDLEFEECDDVCGFQPKKKEKVGGFEFPFGADVEEVSRNAFLTPDLLTATNGKGLEWVAEGCVKRCLDLEFEECDDVCGFQPKKKEKVGGVNGF
ncbi:hypothetical protein SASPL_131078 [Salvia splendens]|uniref:Uncharacterized protein n=1 Tax=Salvia splendens TaxID=180675 RepID=A0A8X8X5B6_SALSN|nr:hypothetical protein SASPL_131078 [Salvia splendens]